MSAPNVNLLLLASVQRAGKPLTSDDVLDYATGYAIDAGWDMADVGALNRRSIAKRLAHLERTGQVEQVGVVEDPRHNKTTPLWAPAAGYDPQAKLPPRPEVALKLARAEEANRQVLAMLKHQSRMVEVVTRFLGELQNANTTLVAELKREED